MTKTLKHLTSIIKYPVHIILAITQAFLEPTVKQATICMTADQVPS